MEELQRQGPPNIIAFVGNKLDLEDERVVSKHDAKQYADDNSLYFIETSGKTNVNVTELFSDIAKILYEVWKCISMYRIVLV